MVEFVKVVIMGMLYIVVLMDSGKCLIFGFNFFGQFGYECEGSCWEFRVVKVLENKKFMFVFCGDIFIVVVSNDGEVFLWGKGVRGWLGLQMDEDCVIFMFVILLMKLKVLFVLCSYSIILMCGQVF